MKKQKGSMTVEASILVPLILFLLMAVIYLMFFMHDCAIMQSFGFRMAESSLWQQSMNPDVIREADVCEIPVFMVNIEEVSCDKNNVLTELLDVIGGREHVKVGVRGELNIAISGSEMFAGSTINANASGSAQRVDYADDRLRAVFWQRQKDGQE